VFDGTMAWAPFVEATVAMVRDHGRLYARGPGYRPPPPGASAPATELYWVPTGPAPPTALPYRVEVVGTTCDPALAVARGVWRRVRTGRSVPAADQLRSHRLFAGSFPRIAPLADSATLFHTGAALTTLARPAEDLAPTVVAHRSAATRGEMLVSPRAWGAFLACARLNDKVCLCVCVREREGERGVGGGRRKKKTRFVFITTTHPSLLFQAACAADLWPPSAGPPPDDPVPQPSLCAAHAGTLLAVLRAADRRDVRRAGGGGHVT
jgi:hypothetical protein